MVEFYALAIFPGLRLGLSWLVGLLHVEGRLGKVGFGLPFMLGCACVV